MTTWIKVDIAGALEFRRENPRTPMDDIAGITIGNYDLNKEKNYGFQCARCDEVEIVKECPNCGKTRYIAGYLEGAPGVFCDKCGIGWSTWKCKKCGTENDSTRSFVMDKPCFIATAVTGTPNSWQVHILRQFRDDVLDHTKSGRGFVRWYYSWSPAASCQLANHSILRTSIRYLVSLISGIALPITWVSQRIQVYQRKHQ